MLHTSHYRRESHNTSRPRAFPEEDPEFEFNNDLHEPYPASLMTGAGYDEQTQ